LKGRPRPPSCTGLSWVPHARAHPAFPSHQRSCAKMLQGDNEGGGGMPHSVGGRLAAMSLDDKRARKAAYESRSFGGELRRSKGASCAPTALPPSMLLHRLKAHVRCSVVRGAHPPCLAVCVFVCGRGGGGGGGGKTTAARHGGVLGCQLCERVVRPGHRILLYAIRRGGAVVAVVRRVGVAGLRLGRCSPHRRKSNPALLAVWPGVVGCVARRCWLCGNCCTRFARASRTGAAFFVRGSLLVCAGSGVGVRPSPPPPSAWPPQPPNPTPSVPVVLCAEFRLSRLYVTSTADPYVQKRTRTLVESPPKAVGDAALPTSPITRPASPGPKPLVAHPKPFIPTGPRVACLVRVPS
jgi:hypothetical protein